MRVTQRSAAAVARRAQIVGATIAVVAAEGFGKASFARIAQQAGLSSTRLISYHFAGKDDLLAAVVEQVVTDIGEHVGGLVGAQETAAGMLRAYVEGVVGFTDTHRAPMRALVEIHLAGAWTGTAQDADATEPLQALLRQGQQAGEFRDFDVRILAQTVQRSVDLLPWLLARDPGLDCTHHAAELVALFDRATRKDPPCAGP